MQALSLSLARLQTATSDNSRGMQGAPEAATAAPKLLVRKSQTAVRRVRLLMSCGGSAAVPAGTTTLRRAPHNNGRRHHVMGMRSRRGSRCGRHRMHCCPPHMGCVHSLPAPTCICWGWQRGLPAPSPHTARSLPAAPPSATAPRCPAHNTGSAALGARDNTRAHQHGVLPCCLPVMHNAFFLLCATPCMLCSHGRRCGAEQPRGLTRCLHTAPASIGQDRHGSKASAWQLQPDAAWRCGKRLPLLPDLRWRRGLRRTRHRRCLRPHPPPPAPGAAGTAGPAPAPSSGCPPPLHATNSKPQAQ